MNSLVGEILSSKYEILEALGSGASSVVYKVKRLPGGEIFAAKILHRYLIEKEDTYKRFVQEAQATMRLSHPNIIKTYEFNQSSEMPYFIMDYIEGTTLCDLTGGGPLNLIRAWNLFLQIADAVEYAHKEGVIHRSIKPGNIMICKDKSGRESAVVSDFGLAKLLPSSGQELQELTAKGAILGSPLYMSPEQCMGREADARTDVYAMGCLMYECISGKPPLKGEGIIQTMSKHLSDLPEGFDAICPELKIPPHVQAIVLKCLAKRPEERYESMEQLKKDLLRYQQGKRPKAMSSTASFRVAESKPNEKEKDPDRILKLTLVLIFILLLGLVAYAVITGPQRKSPDEIQLGKEFSQKRRHRSHAISPLVLLKQADELRLMNHIDEAEELYKEAIIRLEDSEHTQLDNEALATAHWGLAGIFSRSADWTAAEKELRMALYVQSLCPENAAPGKDRLELELAEAIMKQGKLNEAEKILSAVQKRSEDTQMQARAFVMLADLAFLKGNTAEAESYQLKAMEILRGHGGLSRRVYCIVLARYANLLREQGKHDKCISTLRQALAETPVAAENKFDRSSNLFLTAELVRSLAAQGQWGQALELSQAALAAHNMDEPGIDATSKYRVEDKRLLQDLCATVKTLSGDKEGALQELEPKQAYKSGRLGRLATEVRILLYDKQAEAAMKLLLKAKEKALKDLASKAEYRALLALCLTQKGREDEALEEADLAVEAVRKVYDDPLYMYCLRVKCQVLRASGREDAADAIEKIIGKGAASTADFDAILPPYQMQNL